MAFGYNDMSGMSNDSKMRKAARIVNIQAGRSIYDTGSMAFDGHLPRALSFEAGIYPTSKAKGYRETVSAWGEKLMPKPMMDAFDALGEHIRYAKGSGRSKKKKKKRSSGAFPL